MKSQNLFIEKTGPFVSVNPVEMVTHVKIRYILIESEVEDKLNFLRGVEADWIGMDGDLGVLFARILNCVCGEQG